MPKQKRRSSSRLTSQAKKRKKNQRAGKQQPDPRWGVRDSIIDIQQRRDREAHSTRDLDLGRRRSGLCIRKELGIYSMNRVEQEHNTEFRRMTRLQSRQMEQHPDQPQNREARSDPQHKESQQQESDARSPQVCRYYRFILLVIFKPGIRLVSRNHLHAECM